MENPEYQVALVEAADLSAADQAVCISIIKRGDAVDLESAQRELPKAIAVAVVCVGNQIVGVGTIKRRRVKYATKVSQDAHFKFPAATLELGYVAIDPAHWGHGLSHKLVAALLAGRNDALFATTSNDRMKEALRKAGFFSRGQEWDGNHSRLSLWLRHRSGDRKRAPTGE
ncbi:MAG: hypothetical protein JWN63_233 [Candidatus Acidoferrum typicum]|nr:hypothetical protein [Candidatus Acidoferrum typicum]